MKIYLNKGFNQNRKNTLNNGKSKIKKKNDESKFLDCGPILNQRKITKTARKIWNKKIERVI